jgi:urease accessory protein
MKTKLRHIIAAGFLLAAIPVTKAHPGIGPATGFDCGLAHPFGGWDHLLAMLAVGYWASQMRSRIALPAAFLLAMVAGVLAGHWAGPVPGLEQGIAASVLVLGLLIAVRVRAATAVGATLVGVFALLHGAAHGAEMPATAGAVAYGCGLVLATAVLLVAGIAAGELARRLPGRLQATPGWAIAVAGVVMLLVSGNSP